MNATTTADDGALKARLAAHHRTFGPVYGGYLSDHGPMAALAYHGLGASPDLALAYLEHYQQSLEPLADADEGYLSDLKALEHACLTEGVEAVLARELPGLVSGWAGGALDRSLWSVRAADVTPVTDTASNT